MGRFVKVGTRADFERVDGGTLVEAGGQRIALFNLADGHHRPSGSSPVLLLRPRPNFVQTILQVG